MSISVLTQILQADAQAAFSPEISMEIWKKLGANLGYSAATIAATTAVAVTSSTVSTTTAIAGASAVLGAKTSLIVILVAASSVAIIGGVTLFTRIPTKTTQFIAEQPWLSEHSNSDIISGETVGSDISSTVHQSTAQAALAALEPPVSDGSPTKTDKTSDSSFDEMEATTSDIPSDAGSISRPEIVALHNTLYYPMGSQVSAGQILADAGVSITGTDGSSFAPVITYLESVDFNKANTYGVYVHAVDPNGNALTRISIIIVVS